MSKEMNDDDFEALKQLRIPAASEAARQRALEAALLAFDAEQKVLPATQGSRWWQRLRSIVPNKGNWIMDTRLTFGLGTAAVALLVLPLGYQLYNSTAITPVPAMLEDVAPRDDFAASEAQQPRVTAAPEAAAAKQAEAPPLRRIEPEGQAPLGDVQPESEMSPIVVSPSPAEAPASTLQTFRSPGIAPAPMVVRPAEPSGDTFTAFTESPVKVAAEEPVSTFSIDVDTASYAYVRAALTDGRLPDPDAVRIEELINYFDYDYAAAPSRVEPFQPSLEIYPTPWKAGTELLQIGIKGYVPPPGEDKAANLTFLLDTSGSMNEPDKLPLLKRAFALLVDQLSANDTVAIVAYAGSAGVVLEPTRASDKAAILGALDNLIAGGSTAGAEGIELAYRLAAQNKIADGINRVILATDGDFNVGIEDPDELTQFIKARRDEGVFLSVLGFGEGNLGDDTMQALAQNGNGMAAYIDSFREARKVLVEQIGGTLETIAKDVKIQVEFNPAVVAEYRLVGYETRALNREDFNNDKVDAGDVGAGHTVTALYEITPAGSEAGLVDPLRYGGAEPAPAAAAEEYGFLKLRYKLPDADVSQLLEAPITRDLATESLAAASTDARWAAAVAAFGQKLKGSNYGDMEWDEIRTLAQGARGEDANGYRAEFIQLIDGAAALSPDR